LQPKLPTVIFRRLFLVFHYFLIGLFFGNSSH
jgi:hypothetical protein